jgi:hypothetical protein
MELKPTTSRMAANGFADMFLWPWMGAMQSLQQTNGSVAARGPSGMEEVIPLGEEVLEVSKRTENRTHPRKAAYRASAGSVLDLTGVFWSAGKDRQRGGRWRSSPG